MMETVTVAQVWSNQTGTRALVSRSCDTGRAYHIADIPAAVPDALALGIYWRLRTAGMDTTDAVYDALAEAARAPQIATEAGPLPPRR